MRGSKETAEQTRYWRYKAYAGSAVFFCKSQTILDAYKKQVYTEISTCKLQVKGAGIIEKGTSLPDTQLGVVQVIWDKGGAIMFGKLNGELEDRGREWKSNTVLTLLSRLAEQEMITVCKRGRLDEYTARVTREGYRQKQACILAERVFGEGTRYLISVLVKQNYLIKEDYDKLKAFWGKEGGGA